MGTKNVGMFEVFAMVYAWGVVSGLVEVHLGEVAVDGLGEEVAHVAAGGDLLADVGGGEVHHGHVDHGDRGVRGEGAVEAAWAGVDEDAVVG